MNSGKEEYAGLTHENVNPILTFYSPYTYTLTLSTIERF